MKSNDRLSIAAGLAFWAAIIAIGQPVSAAPKADKIVARAPDTKRGSPVMMPQTVPTPKAKTVSKKKHHKHKNCKNSKG